MKKLIYLLLTLSLSLISCKKEKYHLYKIEGKQLKTDHTISEKQTITDIIKPYKNKLNNELNNVLCIASEDLLKTDGPLESSMGNLMADICYTQGNPVFKKRTQNNIDFVLLNYGGIRSTIPKGNITARNAFEVMPFENEMVVVELTGEKVKELLNYLAHEKKAHPIANMRLQLKNDSYQNVIINKKPFDVTKHYFVLTSDYLQQGGDQMTFFKNPISIVKLDYKIRNAMIDYFKKSTTITPNLDNRFSYAK